MKRFNAGSEKPTLVSEIPWSVNSRSDLGERLCIGELVIGAFGRRDIAI